ncbi:MAG: helix-turn-helix domain-containing protein [Shewanella sp.]|nr:helix-turn-helix domain-containing protein [Shewanella sp.]
MTSPQRHRNATTTPEMRRFIQTSPMSVTELSKILNISQATVRKWRNRESTIDGNHTPLHLNTTLTPIEEYVVVGLRSQHQLSLDRLLKATQEFINPNVSRSGLARCLKRYGVSRIDDCDSQVIAEPFFNELPIVQDSGINTYSLNPETLANTLKLPDSDGETVVQVMSLAIPEEISKAQPNSVFIGIDTRNDWVYVDIYQDSNTQAANRYIGYVLSCGPFHLRKLLVRNYHLFLTRFPGVQTNITSARSKATSTPKLNQARLLSGDSV